MALILRLLSVVVCFAFLAGTTVQGAAATKMNLAMLSSDMTVDSLGKDCGKCGFGENSAGTCKLVCSAPVSALNPVTTIGTTGPAKRIVEKTSERLDVGIIPGLDPSPPRTFILF
ncbi:MAG: hypothetical protein COB16_08885 [Rhodobacteraceae bacterium]|nr:MAG: hypothetical protein COB16_08885 [Paracoccaceae bacterium]